MLCMSSLAAKTESAHISATTGLISTKVGVWMDTPCARIILKIQDDRGAQRRAEPQKLEVPISRKPMDRFITRFGMYVNTPCGNTIVKNQDDRGAQPRVIALRFGSVGPRRFAPGLEMRSTESRCEAPWIKVLSTELFLFLGRDRGAQYSPEPSRLRLVLEFVL